MNYYYENGKLYAGEDAVFVYSKTLDVRVIVEDNSTYDHPTPVEDQSKLLSICSTESGNFILVNNITLKNWKPQEANFDSLDGQPSKIFILCLSPLSDNAPHIECLAAIGSVLAKQENIDKILAANTEEEVVAAFRQ